MTCPSHVHGSGALMTFPGHMYGLGALMTCPVMVMCTAQVH